MSQEQTDTPARKGPPLLDSLAELGEALPYSDVPDPSQVSTVLAGLVRYVQTGSLTPPEPPPGNEQAAARTQQDAELARLTSKVEALQRKLAQVPQPPPDPPAGADVLPGATQSDQPPAASA